jgi:indole-3-glycerol phosphate synthase
MTILDRIAAVKREEVDRLKVERGLDSLRSGAASRPPVRPFLPALLRPGKLSLIAELKKASPSKGVIRNDFSVPFLAASYEKGGAQCLSVLTDREFFQGDLAYLASAKAAVKLPVLRKDFIIDPLQVYEAREADADAVLLIAAMLQPHELEDLQSLAWELGMAVLVEVHEAVELDKCLGVGVKLLGINNRNLKDFSLDLKISFDLLRICPPELPVVSESGIFTRADAEALKKAGAAAVLVGEAFMKSLDPGQAVKELMPED